MKILEKSKFPKIFAAILLILPILFLAACDERSTTYVVDEDTTPPPVPTGVVTTTGDGIVWIDWQAIIGVPDLAGYKVWRSLDNSEFFRIATVGRNVTTYEDNTVTNGTTYYYGVSSFDDNGNESDASFNYEIVFDTPRPEGFDEVIYDLNDPIHINSSGFDFSQYEPIFFDSHLCDMYLEYDATLPIPTFFIWLGYNGRFIQDMGYTSSFDDITYAPDSGWSLYDYVEAILGHTYVIQTWDDHFIKVRVTRLEDYPSRFMVFDWGYQIDPGNRELKIEPRSIAVSANQNGAVR